MTFVDLVGSQGGSSSGGSGGLDTAAVDARIAPFARTGSTDLVPRNLLPNLRQRYAKYNLGTRIELDGPGGDFNPPTNVMDFIPQGSLGNSSIVDQWDGNNQIYDYSNGYINVQNILPNEKIWIFMIIDSVHEESPTFRILFRDNTNANVRFEPLFGLEINVLSNNQQNPFGTSTRVPIGFFDKPAESNITRGLIQYVLPENVELTPSTINTIEFLGQASYD